MRSSRTFVEVERQRRERQRREDERPRLLADIPRLTSLCLDIQEGAIKYRWPIVVTRAPALFVVACHANGCEDGGHELTDAILRSLRRGAKRLEGEHACQGRIGDASCTGVLRYVGVATYKR